MRRTERGVALMLAPDPAKPALNDLVALRAQESSEIGHGIALMPERVNRHIVSEPMREQASIDSTRLVTTTPSLERVRSTARWL